MTTTDLKIAAQAALQGLDTFVLADANERTEARRLAQMLRAALAATPSVAVDAKWRMVPVEPDDDMLVAGQEAWMCTNAQRPAMEDCAQAAAVWSAMLELAASPAAATPEAPK